MRALGQDLGQNNLAIHWAPGIRGKGDGGMAGWAEVAWIGMHLFHGQPLSRLKSDKCSARKLSRKEEQNKSGHSAANNPRQLWVRQTALLCCDSG